MSSASLPRPNQTIFDPPGHFSTCEAQHFRGHLPSSDYDTGLLSAEDLLIAVWPNPNSRPSLRWLREQTAKRTLPYIKVGHKVFFNPRKIKQILEKRFEVQCF